MLDRAHETVDWISADASVAQCWCHAGRSGAISAFSMASNHGAVLLCRDDTRFLRCS